MKTLEQFKLENGLNKIDLLQGKGRMYARVGNIDVIVSKSADLTKPLFVIPATNEDGSLRGFQTIVNSDVRVAASI